MTKSDAPRRRSSDGWRGQVRHHAWRLFYMAFIVAGFVSFWVWERADDAEELRKIKASQVADCQRVNKTRRSNNKFHRDIRNFLYEVADSAYAQSRNADGDRFTALADRITFVPVPNCLIVIQREDLEDTEQ
jgi:hypothetical protein